MAWISVHQEVDGTKLRVLHKEIGCSKFEALGILNFLWFWGLKNADETGLVKMANTETIARYLYGCGDDSTVDMRVAAQKLVETGWVEIEGDDLRIHDWDIWQEQWYKYIRTKENNAERKRLERSRKSTKKGAPEPKEEPPATEPKEPEHPSYKSEKKPKTAPKKVKYADFVEMTEERYEKLVREYGKPFTDECIRTLSNYKGANGKKYKDDYLAILNWVVDRVRQRNPGLMHSEHHDDGSDLPFTFGGDKQ